MPRKARVLTDAERAEVETLAAVLTTEQMADYFGIARATFYNIIERDVDVAGRYKRGKAKAIGAIAQSLLKKARAGCTTSQIFYLKTQAGWRETNVVQHDTSDALSELMKAVAANGTKAGRG